MAKRTASMKPKVIKPEEPPIEEIWKMVHNGLVVTSKTQANISRRVDTMLSLKAQADIFFDSQVFVDGYDWQELQKWQKLTEETYDKVAEIMEGLTMEQLTAETLDDPFNHLIPKAEECDDPRKLFEGMIVFSCVRPFGEKLIQAHQAMRDEVLKREQPEE